MPPEGFEPTIPASERPQNYALDRAATGIRTSLISLNKRKLCDYVHVKIVLWRLQMARLAPVNIPVDKPHINRWEKSKILKRARGKFKWTVTVDIFNTYV
jgi:hypothetical protein